MSSNDRPSGSGYFQEVARKASGVRQRWQDYWSTYGGLREIVRSSYFLISLALTIATFGTWTKCDWFSDPISALPNLLGFSLGALTLFLGFGSDRFRDFMSNVRESESAPSSLVNITTAFVHFIVVQCTALLLAFVLKAAYAVPLPQWLATLPHGTSINAAIRSTSWFVGYWCFLYALTLSLAAVMAMFGVVKLYDRHRASEINREVG